MALRGKYRLGFDVWGLVLFMLVMVPNFIWFAVPAPDDILRAESVTPALDAIATVCQVLAVACLCFVTNKGKLRLSPWAIASGACVLMYYSGWILYYAGITCPVVIILLTLPPCAAFILFAVDRKNLPAALFASFFAIGHLIYGTVNYIL